MKRNPFVSRKLLLIICLFFGVFTSSMAQKYDLNTFKFRYQSYKFLNLYFNTSSNKNYNNSSLNSYNYNSSGISFQGNAAYQRSVSSDKFQILENLNYSTKFSRSSFKLHNINLDSAQRNFSFSNYLSYSYSKTKYLKNLKFYVFEGGLTFDLNKKRQPYLTKDNGGSQFVNLGLGKGRIEDVSDAVTAIFIAKEFLKKNPTTQMDSNKLDNLAKGIVEVRNKRFLDDNRFRYIDQITYLDSVCKEMGIMPINPLVFYNILYDNLIFTPSYVRESGKKFTIKGGLANSNTFENNYNEEIFTKVSMYNFNFSTQHKFSKQINEYMQKSHELNLTYSRQFDSYGILDDYEDSWFTNRISFDYNFKFIYQPTTRTVFIIDLPISIVLFPEKEDIAFEKYLNMPFRANGTYFLSRKTNLYATLSLNFRKKNFYDVKSNSLDNYFQTGISHSIF